MGEIRDRGPSVEPPAELFSSSLGSEARPGPSRSPYRGRTVALATMHGKQTALAEPLAAALGVRLVVPAGLDTDAFGTFSGEVPRPGDMYETAVAKARLGMSRAGLALGLASEGSYGPHPYLSFAAGGVELLVFIDDERGLLVTEQLVVDECNHAHTVVAARDELAGFLESIGFPSHGVIVSPNVPARGSPAFRKGLRSEKRLAAAVRAAAAESADGRALVQADMRAHQNPTRMSAIGRLAEVLASRLRVPCPVCRAPGFGRVDAAGGLPCADCGAPTAALLHEVHGCAACPHREVRPRTDGVERAEPRFCNFCNP